MNVFVCVFVRVFVRVCLCSSGMNVSRFARLYASPHETHANERNRQEEGFPLLLSDAETTSDISTATGIATKPNESEHHFHLNDLDSNTIHRPNGTPPLVGSPILLSTVTATSTALPLTPSNSQSGERASYSHSRSGSADLSESCNAGSIGMNNNIINIDYAGDGDVGDADMEEEEEEEEEEDWEENETISSQVLFASAPR